MIERPFQSLRSYVALTLVAITSASWADDKLNSLLNDGKFAKAVEHVEKSLPAGQRTVEIWLQYADALDRSGADKQKIMNAFDEAQKVQPSDPRIFAQIGEYHTRHKNFKDALKPFQKWYLLERSAKAAESMATCAMHLKQYDMARDAAESAIKLDSSSLESRKILSFLYFNDKNWSEAALQLEAIVAKIKDDVTYWKKLARCYEELNNRDKLVVAAGRIVALDPKDVRSRGIMVEHYLNKKDGASALPLLKELAVLTPEDSKVFKSLYQLSIAANQKKDAVLYLRNFLILDSSDATSYKTLGDLEYEQKNLDEALDAYRKTLKLNPSAKGLYRQYITILLERKLDDEALEVATKAAGANEIDAATYAALGDVHKKRNQCTKAIGFYQNVLKTDVKNLSVLSSLAECQVKTGKPGDALLNYRQVVMLNPEAFEEYKEIGNLLSSQNKTDEAVENYRKYLDKKPSDERIASTVGIYYYGKKQYRDALRYFDNIKDRKLLNLSLLITIGDCHFQTENYVKTVEYLSAARKLNPSRSDLQNILKPLAVSYEKTGSALDAAKAYEAYVKIPGVKDADAAFKQAFLREEAERASAVTLYQANIESFPEDPRNFARLGILLSDDKQQGAKAVEILEKASALDPKDTLVLQKLCDAYHSMGKASKELATAARLAASQPGNIIANRRAGSIHYRKKDYAAAIPYLEKVAAAQPKETEIAQMLADAYMQSKNYPKAVDAYVRLKDLQPDNTIYRLSLIEAAEAAGLKEKTAEFKSGLAAIDKKIVSKDDKAVDSRLRLAEYLYAKGDFDGAWPLYKELAVLTPKDRQVFSRLVDISGKKGKSGDAQNYLKSLVALDPANGKAHADLGNLLYDQKDMDNALTEYRAALKADPSIGGFFKRYAEIVVAKNLDDEALTVLGTAIKKNEADQKMIITLGKIHQKKKKYPEAIELFKKASTNDPKNLEVLSLLGECQAASKDITGAIVTFEQVVLLNPKAVSEFKALGDLQMKQGKVDEAVKSYLSYLNKSPSDEAVAKTVGLYLYKKQDYTEAIRHLEMVKTPDFLTAEHLLALGDSYYQTKNCEKVCSVYSRLNTKKASETTLKKILRPLAECYEKTNEPLKAADAYHAYAALPGINDSDALYLRVFLREKNDTKAVEALYLANIKAFPKDYRNHLRLGILYANNPATLSKAAASLSQAATLNPADKSILMKLAQIWNALKNDDRELDTYNKLLVKEPQNLEANRRAGALLMKKKQYSKAIECLEIAGATSGKDAELMLMLSDAYLKTDKKEKAVEVLAKVHSDQKSNPDLMFQLYTIYKELGKDKDAEAMIKQLIGLKKENRYRIMYADDLIDQKRYDEAKSVTDELLKSDAMNLDGLMLSGRIQAYQKNYDDAIETFKMVSYVKEDYAPANYERGEIYRQQKSYDRAETYYLKALETDPKSALAELGLALIYKAQNRQAEYESHLNKARALDPNDKKILAETKEKEPPAAPKK